MFGPDSCVKCEKERLTNATQHSRADVKKHKYNTVSFLFLLQELYVKLTFYFLSEIQYSVAVITHFFHIKNTARLRRPEVSRVLQCSPTL
jgi:hypothetical protein